VGVVLQENLLFHRSVRENIAVTDPAAPLEAVMEAARSGRRARVHQRAARGLRHAGGRAGHGAERRAAPARGHRPRALRRPAHPHPGRSHQRAGLRERGHPAAQHGQHLPGPHRASSSRTGCRAVRHAHRIVAMEAGPHRRGGLARRAAGRRRPVRAAVVDAGGHAAAGSSGRRAWNGPGRLPACRPLCTARKEAP
jgi:subfamily B ATP-binding cassette protein HlyB/CyaB